MQFCSRWDDHELKDTQTLYQCPDKKQQDKNAVVVEIMEIKLIRFDQQINEGRLLFRRATLQTCFFVYFLKARFLKEDDRDAS